jgi:hypothetical protein
MKMQIFDTLPDNLVATLSTDELISKLYCGSDRDFKIAALLEKARGDKKLAQGYADEYDEGYNDGFNAARECC